MVCWAIYGPGNREFPGQFVVRRWHSAGDGTPVPDLHPLVLSATVDGARSEVRRKTPALVPIERSPQDDPTLIESWF